MGVKIRRKTASALTQAEGPAVLSLPFDHYQRYHLTKQIASILWGHAEDHPLLVLDVGGSSSSLKHFLAKDEVVLADVQPPPEFTYRENVPFVYDDYLLGAGGHLPFGDGAFDLVTAHDTLEHVPPESREAFLLDLVRVSKRYVVLDGPIHREETARAERLLRQFVRDALGGHNQSLDEHVDLGLPERSMIEGTLTENGYQFKGIPNGNLYRWMWMMALKHYILAFPDSETPHVALDRTYNQLLSHDDFGPFCYREAYVIAKHEDDAPALDKVKKRIPRVASEPQADSVEAFESLLATLEAHSRGLKQKAADREHRIAEQDFLLSEKDAFISELNKLLQAEQAEVAKRDRAVASAQEEIAERDRELGKLEEQLAEVEQSLGYKVLSSYRRGMSSIFPTDQRRGAPYRRAKGWVGKLFNKEPQTNASADGKRPGKE